MAGKDQRGVRGRPGKGRPRTSASQASRAGNGTATISAPAARTGLPGPAAIPGNCRGAARRRGRLRPGWVILAGALVVLGAVLVAIAVLAQETPPAPPWDLGTIPAPRPLTRARTSPRPPAAGQAGEAAARISAVRQRPGLPLTPTAAAGATPSTRALAWSLPASLAIPAIGVHTKLVGLGLGPHHTLQVPPLTSAGVQEAGWYDLGAAPGQLGPAVIAGHVDSQQGPGVFFRLGAMRPGEQIHVTRADGIVATFRVDAVDEYRKDNFPTLRVYGPVGYAGLRVITCGGRFDYQTHHYLSNIVVYATLTGSRPVRNR